MNPFDPLQPVPEGVTLLEASAGTGKTHNIVNLVVKLIAEDDLPIDSILVVTFTEAATAELRERIRRRLRSAAIALATGAPVSKDALVTHWLDTKTLPVRDGMIARLRSALEHFDAAAIHTIHGFCSRVLQDYAFECGQPFDTELLEDPTELLDEIVRTFWATHLVQASLPAVRAVCDVGGVSFDDLAYLGKRAIANPDAVVLPACPLGMICGPDILARAGEAFASCADIWRRNRQEIESVLAEAIQSKVLSNSKWRPAQLASRLQVIDGWLMGVQSTPKLAESFTPESLGLAVNTGKSAPVHPAFDAIAAVLKESQDTAFLLKHAFVTYVRAEFEARKQGRGLHTFDDLLRRVCQALRDPMRGNQLAHRIRARFRAALIDEFQDTDAIQWEIFRSLFAVPGARMVLIGDPKQSIYAFRGADISTYLEAKAQADREFGLPVNWRSDPAFVDALNGLFMGQPQPFAVPGIEYSPVKAAHEHNRLAGDTLAPIRVRFLPREDGAERPMSKDQANAILPSAVAADIVRCLQSEAQIGDMDSRSVTPGDCAVLVRTGREAVQIQNALRNAGVPSVLKTEDSVFTSAEGEELYHILAAVLHPSSASLIRRALATDLLGFAAAAELEIGVRGGGDVLATLDAHDSALDRWVERFHDWAEIWSQRGLMPLVRTMMRALNIPEVLLRCIDGERRLTNLLHLAELLHAQGVERQLEPPVLLEWFARQRQRSDTVRGAQQLRLESDANAVQIVTIHSSKGLQYPLVWCPYLWNQRDPARRMQYPFVRNEREEKSSLHLYIGSEEPAHSMQAADEEFADALRIQYVALTRAQHRCTLWWGAIGSAQRSALGHLLHGGTGSSVRTVRQATESAVGDLLAQSDTIIWRALEQRAAASGGQIVAEREEHGAPVMWQGSRTVAPSLDVRAWQRTTSLDRQWRVGSFSWMTRRVHPVGAAQAALLEEAPEPVGDLLASVQDEVPIVDQEPALLADFPAGANVGISLHKIFEDIDFTVPATIPGVVNTVLGASALGADFEAAQWVDRVASAVTLMLDTELRGAQAPFRLNTISRAQRLNELAFDLPVQGGYQASPSVACTPQDIAAVFRDYPGGSVPDTYAELLAHLPFDAFRGFLNGVIDLVAEHDGRYYVLDYKSNYLGATRSAYAPAHLAVAMTGAHYFLQYHLYMVALDRYLALRLPGYTYDRHIGGVYYLFLRGMHPDHPSETGVFFDLPPYARIQALGRVLSGMPSPSRAGVAA